MPTYIRYDDRDAFVNSGVGLDYAWLTKLFLGESRPGIQPTLLAGISEVNYRFACREALATTITEKIVEDCDFTCVDPCASTLRCSLKDCLTTPDPARLNPAILPIFYRFKSASEEDFFICISALYGRVTQIFFPKRDVLFFTLSRATAESVMSALDWALQHGGRPTEAATNYERLGAAGVVGILDMITNHGHQIINQLSGLQRLLDLKIDSRISEVWTCGSHFYGELDSLFPEFLGKIRNFRDRIEMAREALRIRRLYVRIGSTYLSRQLQQRILRHTNQSGNVREYKSIVVTVRQNGRNCINLPEVIPTVFDRLSKTFRVKIAFDGWVTPESAKVAESSVGAAFLRQNAEPIRAELELAREIAARLPRGAVESNVIGQSMMESLDRLSGCEAYISHVGTLQHKLGMLLGMPGVVHGPLAQIINPEAGSYLSEVGEAPTFTLRGDVDDVPTVSSRGQGFSDYRISNIDHMTESLMRILGRGALCKAL